MKTVVGDVLYVDRGIIVQGVNCDGVMGAGIALQIRKKFPTVYAAYKDQENETGLVLGNISYAKVADSKWIVNANTQQTTGYGKQVSYDAIEDCFRKVVELYGKILSRNGERLPIYFPKIGAGLGGGNWKIIETIIDETIPQHINRSCFVLE